MSIIGDVEKSVIGFSAGHVTLLATLAGALGLFAGYAFWRNHVYGQGFDACKAEEVVAQAAYDEKVNAAKAETAAAVAQGEAAVAQAKAARPVAQKAVQTALQSAPVFAATARPAELYDQRRRELAAIGSASGSGQ